MNLKKIKNKKEIYPWVNESVVYAVDKEHAERLAVIRYGKVCECWQAYTPADKNGNLLFAVLCNVSDPEENRPGRTVRVVTYTNGKNISYSNDYSVCMASVHNGKLAVFVTDAPSIETMNVVLESLGGKFKSDEEISLTEARRNKIALGAPEMNNEELESFLEELSKHVKK